MRRARRQNELWHFPQKAFRVPGRSGPQSPESLLSLRGLSPKGALISRGPTNNLLGGSDTTMIQWRRQTQNCFNWRARPR
jgi:hypothetical protein